MATHRAIVGFSLGPSRGDVAAGTDLTVGTEISAQEAVVLLRSGYISTPTMAASQMTAQAYLTTQAASGGWVQNEYVEADSGYALGVADVAAHAVLYVAPQQKAAMSAAGRLMKPFAITSSVVPFVVGIEDAADHGVISKPGVSYVGHLQDFTMTMDPDNAMLLDTATTTVNGVAVNGDWLAIDGGTGVTTLTLTAVAANASVAVHFKEA